MKRSTRKTQWVGVAVAAVFLAITMWPRHAPAPSPVSSPSGAATGTDRSFDDLASEHGVDVLPRDASHAEGATQPAGAER